MRKIKLDAMTLCLDKSITLVGVFDGPKGRIDLSAAVAAAAEVVVVVMVENAMVYLAVQILLVQHRLQ